LLKAKEEQLTRKKDKDTGHNMTNFNFEADPATIPVIGSRWEDKPEKARVYYQNKKCRGMFGELQGVFLTDLLSEVANFNSFDGQQNVQELMQKLHANGSLKGMNGTLFGKRVEIFSEIQKNTANTIQTSIIDVSNRFVDPLSGIPGRDLFFDHLDIELYRAQRERGELHICYLNLTGLKQANDLYGHKAGDDVIVEVAQRLRGMIRKHETVARFAGNEFVVLLSGSKVDSMHFANNKLLPILTRPYLADDYEIDFIGVNVGIAYAPAHTNEPDALVNHANDAMYIAKARGKNKVVSFEEGMQSHQYEDAAKEA